MTLRRKTYKDRLVDKKIEDYLKVFGAVSIEGPKWCGKTWTSLCHANTLYPLDDPEIREKAGLDENYVLEGEPPILLDEWNLRPELWDAVRRKCDETTKRGRFLLTCSTQLKDGEAKAKIHHSGAGRIGRLRMYPMSLYESGDSSGEASLEKMMAGTLKAKRLDKKPRLEELARLCVRGGWPSNINVAAKQAGILPKSYLEAVLDKDMNDDKRRDRTKMEMLLKSLARNETSLAGNKTLVRDISETEGADGALKSRETMNDYLDVLMRLHILEGQPAYSENYRSAERVGKTAKRHFVDPSLACAALSLTAEKLVSDLHTFGLFFESLVERDLRIYGEYHDAKLYHFRDNISGLEVDAILEFPDGEYAAFEIKLGFNSFEEARSSLVDFAANATKKPKLMCVVVGNLDAILRDPETGIYAVPATALGV